MREIYIRYNRELADAAKLCGSRFLQKGESCLSVSFRRVAAKAEETEEAEKGERIARGGIPLFYYAAYVRDFLPINSADGNTLGAEACRIRIVSILSRWYKMNTKLRYIQNRRRRK